MGSTDTPVFKTVAKKSQLDDGQKLCVELENGISVLLAQVNGTVFATSNLCTHLHGKMHLGTLQGYRIACPLHGGAFDIRTGAPLCEVVRRPLESYPVRINGEDVEVALPRDPLPPASGFEW